MQATVHDVFMAMYYALEAATDNYPDQGLKALVRDADPFVWKDRLSADPAVYAEFSEAFLRGYGEEAVSNEEARSFCRKWLADQALTHDFYKAPLVEAFDSIAEPDDWASALSDVVGGE